MAASGFFFLSFTQAKLLFMAIRRLLFPEDTVSQTASYCLTTRLWCRAQTLSPTPPLLLYASLLCWFSELLFLSENLYEATERKETRKRDGEGAGGRERGGRHTERQSGAGEENCDSSEAVIDASSMCLRCTLPAKRRALLICSHISIKKVGSQPHIFLCASMNYQPLTK